MGTGANGGARVPATYATYTSGSGTSTLAFIYAVTSGDTASDLDYASTAALEANGGTIRNLDGFDATLTLAQPGQSGSISAGNAIVIDATPVPVTPVPETGGGGGGGGSTTTTPATTAKPVTVTVTPVQVAPSVPATVPSGVTPPTPSTITPEVAARAELALASVDASTRMAYDTIASALDPAERAALTAFLAGMPANRAAAYIANIAALPGILKIATGGTSAVASDGTVTTSFDVDDEDPAPSAWAIDGAVVAGVGVSTTARRTVVVLVPAGQRALINRGRSGTWPNIALPLPAGAQAGLTSLLSLPAVATSLRFDPTPGNLNVVQQGSLGGGIVTPLAAPFAIAVIAPQAPDATIDLSLPSVKVGPGQAFGYLFSVNAPDGSFFGYLRAPARFEPSTGRQTWPMTARALQATLFMPVVLTPAYVQNFSADAHIHSGPDAFAVDFGVAGPAFTTFTVVGPQMGNRIYVYSPVTAAYGWVDASGVGPSGPPGADAHVPGEWPEYVRNIDAEARLWSNPTTAAVDFGSVGRAGVIYTVIDQQMQRYFVVNGETGNYAWIDVSTVRPYVPVMTPSPTVTRVLTPTVTIVPSTSAPSTARTRSADVRVFSNPTTAAIDFGPVGPAGTVLTVIGPQDGPRTFVFNPVTENYGWINLTDIEPVAGPPAPVATLTPIRTITPVATTSTKPAMPSGTLPKLVSTINASAHVFAHEGQGAADFGLIGPAGTVLTVIGPLLDGRLFVFNPVTENYGWVNVADTVPVDGPPAPAASRAVRTRTAEVHVFSNPTAAAIDFGPVGPAGTVLTVIGPQDGSRTFIFNPVTENYGWINLTDVEPIEGTPTAVATPTPVRTPTPVLATATKLAPVAATTVPTVSAPSTARTRSADVRVYSNPTAAAIDFGPVGPAGTVLTVIGPQDGTRTFIFNPVTENYGWVNLTDIEPVAGPPAPTPVVTTPTRTSTPIAAAPTRAPGASSTPKLVRTTNPDAHAFAHEGPGAIDFGPVGPVGTVLTVIGPQLDGRLFIFNSVTENYGWVNLTDTVAVDGPPAPTPVAMTPTRTTTPVAMTPTRTASTSATGVPTKSAPRTARTRSADVRVYSNPTAGAIDFGPVGPTGTVLTVIGPQDGSRTFIFNPVTENYGWVEVADLEP